MTTKASPLKRAIKAAKEAMSPQRYGVHGKASTCRFCGHDRFKIGNYVGLLMMHTLVCADCGHVEFFTKLPKTIDP